MNNLTLYCSICGKVKLYLSGKDFEIEGSGDTKLLCEECLNKSNNQFIKELNSGSKKEVDKKLCKHFIESGFIENKNQWKGFKKKYLEDN